MRVHLSHSPFYCSQTLQLCTCMPNILPYNQTDLTNHIHNAHIVPISTSGMLAHILNDCCRETAEGQTEKEDTKSG